MNIFPPKLNSFVPQDMIPGRVGWVGIEQVRDAHPIKLADGVLSVVPN